jgi:Peptidase family M28
MMRERLLLRLFLRLLLLVLLSLAAACSRSVGVFSEPNARAHIAMLAGTIGSRPIGTEANARARAYVVDQLRLYGYDVRVQETDARRPELGRTAHVANIIAVLPGKRSEAIGLLSHYDSSPASPGAADDGLGVAVSLEAARVLAARQDRMWSTLVLVTDGEESGLMGAAALVTDREVRARLQAYINIEAAGSSGPAMLFEAGPVNGWIVGPWARRAPHPRGASFGVEIYRRLPNDTDFTILGRQGLPGLNFALIGDGYSYHTARDVPERLSSRTIRDVGENVVATAEAFDGIDVTRRTTSNAMYFDIGGIAALSFPAIVGWLLSGAAVLAGVLACAKILPAAVRIGGVLRWMLTAVWSGAGFLLSAAAMAGATWGLRAAREVNHPWYARPDRLFLLLLAVGVTIAWTMSRAGQWLPARARGLREPLVTWSIILPVWLTLALAMLWLAPGAAYLWSLPLLTAGILLLLVPAGSPPALRAASVVVLAVTATLWLPDTLELLRFTAALFGRLPLVTPVYVYAALMTAAGVMLAPPFIAAVASTRPLVRPSLVTTLCLLSVAAAAGYAYSAPAYTFDQPQRRVVRALQEPDIATAVWEVASLEPGLDLSTAAPGGWSPQSSAAEASIPWGRLPHPFVFRASGPALGPAPLDVAAFTMQPVAAGTEVTVTAVPRRRGVVVSFVLPQGVTPARSSLPGVLRLGRWTATYIAPSEDGILWRAGFGAAASGRLQDIRLVVTDSGFPDGSGWQRLPGWIPQDRAVWTASATWVIRADPPRPIEPAPALR